jgi:hypothetical protein
VGAPSPRGALVQQFCASFDVHGEGSLTAGEVRAVLGRLQMARRLTDGQVRARRCSLAHPAYRVAVPRGLHPLRPNSAPLLAQPPEPAGWAPPSISAAPPRAATVVRPHPRHPRRHPLRCLDACAD